MGIPSEPTESKWEVRPSTPPLTPSTCVCVVAQVVEETYGWVLILVEHNFARFASFVRGILRGTKTGDLAKHVLDSHIDNWDRIRGALADVYLMAAVRVRWEYSLKYM